MALVAGQAGACGDNRSPEAALDAGIDAAPQEAGWLPSSTIHGFGLDDLEVSASGDVFLAASGSVRRWLRATQAWNGLYQVGSGHLVVDDAGNALVAHDHARGAITGVTFTAGGGWASGWSRPAQLTPVTTDDIWLGALAMTGDGSAAMTWTQRPLGGEPVVRVALFEPDRGWTAPFLLPRSALTMQGEIVVLADLGSELRLVVGWVEGREDTFSVHADVLTYDRATGVGAWAGVTRLDDGTDAQVQLDGVGIDQVGRATALLRGRSTLTAVRRLGRVWSPTVVASGEPGEVWIGEADLAVDPDGAIHAAWTQCSPTCAILARRSSSGGWEPAVELAAPADGGYLGRPRIAASGGRALAIWQGASGDRSVMWARELVGTWSPARLLDDTAPDLWISDYRVAFRRGQVGVASWTRWSEQEPPTVSTAIYLSE